MSGGFFDYKQDLIRYIADTLEAIIKNNGRTRTELHESCIDEIGDLFTISVDWRNPVETFSRLIGCYGFESPDETRKWISKHNSEKAVDFSPATIREFKRGVLLLRKAAIYAQRIDWLLSDDDGEDSFHECLKEELDALKKCRRSRGCSRRRRGT